MLVLRLADDLNNYAHYGHIAIKEQSKKDLQRGILVTIPPIKIC